MSSGVCVSSYVNLFLNRILAVSIYRPVFLISKLTVATYLQASEAVVQSICMGAAEGLAGWRRHCTVPPDCVSAVSNLNTFNPVHHFTAYTTSI